MKQFAFSWSWNRFCTLQNSGNWTYFGFRQVSKLPVSVLTFFLIIVPSEWVESIGLERSVPKLEVCRFWASLFYCFGTSEPLSIYHEYFLIAVVEWKGWYLRLPPYAARFSLVRATRPSRRAANRPQVRNESFLFLWISISACQIATWVLILARDFQVPYTNRHDQTIQHDISDPIRDQASNRCLVEVAQH